MKSFTSVASVIALAALTATSAYAQTAEQTSSDGDIIVTASRTETLLSKTPIAVTAITGEGLRTAGVTNPTALGDQVPNLQINRVNNGIQLTIRGVSSNDTSEKGDPSAAFLQDGIYIARPQAQEVSLFDIARIEVLRGPQGTLYGRNTTAGVLNVITNRPSFDFGGSVDVAAGNYGTWQGTGVLNIPASDKLAFRFGVNYDQRDNFIDAGPRLTGRIDPFKKNLSGRAQALYQWDTGNLLIRGDYSRMRGTPYDQLPLGTFYRSTVTGVDPIYIPGKASTQLYENAQITWDTALRNNTWGVSAELTQDVGPLTMTYLGSYRELHRDEDDAAISFDATNAYRRKWKGSYWQNSQELRFATNGDGPFKMQFGGYYFFEQSDIALFVLAGTPNPGRNGTGQTTAFLQNPTKAKSYAFFGQGTYSLTDTLRLTGGVRYSHDDKSRQGATISCADFFTCTRPAGALTNNASASFSKVTWRAAVDFDMNTTTLLFGSVASGYKAGGFNDGCEIGNGANCIFSRDALYYAPETLIAYEAGMKTRFLNNAIRLNISAFHTDYNNIQLSQAVANCGNGLSCSVTQNGGKASVSGVEVEGVLKPSDHDQVDFSVSYLDAHFKEFAIAPYNFAGRSLDRAPRWTMTAGYQHSFTIGDGELVAGVRTRMSDSYTILQIATRNFYRQPSFTKTDATLTYNAPNKRWYLQGFIKNIENEITVNNVVIGVRSQALVGDPRTYGARAGFKF